MMEVLFREGDPAPGGGEFSSLYGSANVNSSGVVAVGEYITNPNAEGIWTSAGGYLRTGDMGPRGLALTNGPEESATINSAGTIAYYGRDADGEIYGTYNHGTGVHTLVEWEGRDLGAGVTISDLSYSVRNNDSNSVIYWAEDSGGNERIMRDQATIAKAGDAAPNGDTYDSFWRPNHNNAGQAVFMADLDDGSDVWDAICTDTAVVAREGDATAFGGTWDWMRSPDINSAGDVAWWGGVDTGGDVVDGYYTASGPVVQEGDLAPNGMTYVDFSHAPSFNANGDWIFYAEVVDAGGNEYAGVFTLDDVVALGGDLDPDGNVYAQWFERPTLNDQGWFAFAYYTQDDAGQIDKVMRGNLNIPEPSTFLIWSLLGALGIAWGWYRRKS